MAEEQHQQSQVQAGTGKSKKTVNKWVAIVLLILFLVSAGFLISLWMSSEDKEQSLQKKNKDLQSQVDKLEKQLKEEKAKAAKAEEASEEDAASCPDVDDELLANIEAAVTSKNYAALAGYMTNPLTVVYAASEFGGPKTPDEAVAAMDYLKNASGEWDFELPDEVTASYQEGDYDQYFPDAAYVGKSSDGLVVSFDFDCGDISQIFISASEEIL